MKYKINIPELEKYYRIEEGGAIVNIKTGRALVHGTWNGYHYVLISPLRQRIQVHKLVALKYLGYPESMGYEVNHIDGDRGNNHVSNLEWVTHSENVKKSYDLGRKSYWKGKAKWPHSEETKAKMAARKNKRVLCDGVEYHSIAEVLSVIRVSRRTFNNKISSGEIRGHEVRVLGLDLLVSNKHEINDKEIIISPVNKKSSYSLEDIEENYEICNNGRIISKKTDAFITPVIRQFSVSYNLKVKWFNIQIPAGRIVAMKYLPSRREGDVIIHKDENPYNNEASNLQWASLREVRLKKTNQAYPGEFKKLPEFWSQYANGI